MQLWLRLLTLSAVLKKTGKVHKEVSLVHQRTHPVESDGGSDGHTSDTGVVPSEETSSWVNGWCSKNLDTSSKLQNTHQQGYSGFNLITFINSWHDLTLSWSLTSNNWIRRHKMDRNSNAMWQTKLQQRAWERKGPTSTCETYFFFKLVVFSPNQCWQDDITLFNSNGPFQALL